MEYKKNILVNETSEVEGEYIQHKNEILDKADMAYKEIMSTINPKEAEKSVSLFEYVYAEKVLSLLTEWGRMVDANKLSPDFVLKIKDLIEEGEKNIYEIQKQKEETGRITSSLLPEVKELVIILKQSLNTSALFDSLSFSNITEIPISEN